MNYQNKPLLGNVGPIGSMFQAEDGARSDILDRVRRCCSLTKPWLEPPLGQTANDKLPETYQSVGSRGVNNLEGKMLMDLWPLEQSWFQLLPSAEIRFDQEVISGQPDKLQAVYDKLFLMELLIQAKLESASLTSGSPFGDNRSGFRSRKRMALSYIIVTGDTLEQLTDEYRVKVFRRSQYTTMRDSSGDVLHHTVCEAIDPLALSEDQQSKTEFNIAELKEKHAHERLCHIYTLVEWQPWTRKWVITQEVNGKEIVVTEEPISPFFSTPYELSPGENYGRGLVELNLGDMTSLNELCKRRLDLFGLATKGLVALDYAARVTEKDLTKPPGSVIRARVTDGKAMDVGVVQFNVSMESQLLSNGIETIGNSLGKAMMIESETAPRGEAGRSPVAWQRTAIEIDGATSGAYAPIADNQQVPLIKRCMYQLSRDKLIPAINPKLVEIRALTGISAMGREVQARKLLDYTQVAAALGEEAIARVNKGVLMQVLARYRGINEPGLIRTDEEMNAIQQQQMAMQAQAQAAEQAISTTGAVVENAAAQSAVR